MSSPHAMLPPPPPPPDFPNFGFDSTFPPPPPLPSSADLFSSSETNDLFGFLDSFGFDFDAPLPSSNTNNAGFDLGYTQQHQPSLLDPPASSSSDANAFGSLLSPSFGSDLGSFAGPQSVNGSTSTLPHPLLSHDSSSSLASPSTPTQTRKSTRAPSKRKAAASNSRSRSPGSGDEESAAAKEKKALLSSPQKRLNHILSEQKRRNAIRDGYAALTTLLAPAGAPPGSGMPTRGRPKGSGASGRGKTRGKSGVLFRAVEYVRWLEEGVGELEREVGRVERMASAAA